MELETKICQNCKKDFVIEPDDFAFYEKFDLLLPVLCPYCRCKYLLALWVLEDSESQLALSGKRIITVLPESVPFPIYDRTEFVSDARNPLIYGRDYDESCSFLE